MYLGLLISGGSLGVLPNSLQYRRSTKVQKCRDKVSAEVELSMGFPKVPIMSSLLLQVKRDRGFGILSEILSKTFFSSTTYVGLTCLSDIVTRFTFFNR